MKLVRLKSGYPLSDRLKLASYLRNMGNKRFICRVTDTYPISKLIDVLRQSGNTKFQIQCVPAGNSVLIVNNISKK